MSGTPALNMTFAMIFMSKILQHSESPWITSTTNVSKASESHIRLTLNAANRSVFSPTFIKNIYISFQKQELLNNLHQQAADCFSDLRLRREDLVASLKNRREDLIRSSRIGTSPEGASDSGTMVFIYGRNDPARPSAALDRPVTLAALIAGPAVPTII